MKRIFFVAVLIMALVFAGCKDDARENTDQFELRVQEFLKAANRFDPADALPPNSVYQAFADVNRAFVDLMQEPSSFETFGSDVIPKINSDCGFQIVVSDVFVVDQISYQIVELNNAFQTSTMGAYNMAYLQSREQGAVSSHPLVPSICNSGEYTHISSYRFFEEEQTIAFVQQRQSDVFNEAHKYSIYFYRISGNGVENIVPLMENQPWENGDWTVSQRTIQSISLDYSIISISNETSEPSEIDVQIVDQTFEFSSKDNERSELVLELKNGTLELLNTEIMH